jgi:hypothetical protein
MNKYLNRIRISVGMIVILSTVALAPFAHAADAVDDLGGSFSSSGGGYVCDPSKFAILKLLNSYSTSIVSTALTHNESLSSIKPFYMLVGMSAAEQQGCLNYLAENAGLPSCFNTAIKELNCPDSKVEYCESLINSYNVADGGYNPRKFANSKVSGSLLGYAYFVQNTMRYEPVPVNTAYFFKDYAAKLPVVGETVYAQNQVDYGHTLINAVLNIWKVFRNMAYALMAVIMLWVGFAIITRRRINAQTVVNVQYALPKIVIALVFIALSYPIGALMTSFAWTLFHSAPEIITSITGDQRIAALQTTACYSFTSGSSAMAASEKLGLGGLSALIGTIATMAAGAGPFWSLIALTQGVVILFYLFAYIKAIWLYFKMVMNTAWAPLQIALYALPGNDDKLENWFKQMVAWGAGIFAMALILKLTQGFSVDMILQTFAPVLEGQSVIQNSIVSGSLYNVILAPMLMVFGAALAISAPGKIEEALIGKKGGKR